MCTNLMWIDLDQGSCVSSGVRVCWSTGPRAQGRAQRFLLSYGTHLPSCVRRTYATLRHLREARLRKVPIEGKGCADAAGDMSTLRKRAFRPRGSTAGMHCVEDHCRFVLLLHDGPGC